MAIYCIGDIHGKFDILVQRIRELKPNSHLLCVGDVGLGFEDSQDPSCLQAVNDIASELNIHIWMIRGNHDNPYLFRTHQATWNEAHSHIKLMADVDSLELEGQHVIFVGGAISVDRSHEGRIEGYSWWKEEPVHESCPSRVYHIVEQFGPADLIITHAGPVTTLPVLDLYEPNIYHYSQEDPNLFNDISIERTRLSDCVQYSRAPMCVYGHYHVTLEYSNTGVDYRCCAELEVWEFQPKHTAPLPKAVISAEEKAKVETAPIRIKAPLAGTPKPDIEVASSTTEDATSDDLIKKTEELRKTSLVSLKINNIPRVKTTAITQKLTKDLPSLPPLTPKKEPLIDTELPVAKPMTEEKPTTPLSLKPVEENKKPTLDKPSKGLPKLPPLSDK